jgi:tetratricopeptide (TPR) repeat protein
MNPEHPDPLADDLVARMAAYDESLAGEATPAGSDPPPVAAGLQPRWQRLRGCIDLLRHAGQVRASVTGPWRARTEDGGPSAPAQPHANSTFGRFRLLRELGRGGFGVVFLADDPALRRQVALKVPRPEVLAEPALRQRFLREAQAAASLDHPNLVPVHEVGAVGPVCYIVSTYCPGPTLAVWLRQQPGPLPPRQAAALLACLAGAIQHAHAAGIVHRDLKPANVLLVPRTEPGPGELDFTPRLTDFGLAKLLDAAPDQTTTGALGTPLYMAPEQAERRGREVGPACDIYALGAILYELLTGRPPFLGPTPMDILRQVSSAEPVPVNRLQPGVPRDLCTICLKCLQKEPSRRYHSARLLAEDLERFLEERSILAQPVPAWERAWKWARRRPTAAASLALSSVCVLCLFVLWGWFTVQLRTQRNLAQTNEREAKKQWRRAEANQEKTLAAVERFLARVGDARLAGVPQMELVRQELLADALEFFQDFLKEKDDPEPLLRRDAARAYHRTGRIKHQLGQLKQAADDFRQAAALLRQLVREYPDEPAYRFDLAKSLHNLGELAEALDIKQRLVADFPEQSEYRRSLAQTYTSLGIRHRRAGRLAESEAAHGTAVTLLEALVRSHPDDIENRATLANALNNLAVCYGHRGQGEKSEQTLLRVRDVYLELVRTTSRSPAAFGLRTALVRAHINLAIAHQQMGRLTRARAEIDKAIGLQEQIVRDLPMNPDHQSLLANAHNTRASIYWSDVQPSLNQPEKAAPEILKCVDILKGLVRNHPASPTHRLELGKFLNSLSAVYEVTGKRTLSAPANREAVALLEGVVREQPGDVDAVVSLACACYNSSGDELDSQKPDASLAWLVRAEKLLCDGPNRPKGHVDARLLLGRVWVGQARIYSSTSRLTHALNAWDRAVELGSYQPLESRLFRGRTRAELGDHEGAAADARVLVERKPYVQGPRWYADLALLYGAAGNAAARDGKLVAAERARLTAKYDDRALELVGKAVAAGVFDDRGGLKTLKTSPDLARLQARPEFQEWARQVEAKVAKSAPR